MKKCPLLTVTAIVLSLLLLLPTAVAALAPLAVRIELLTPIEYTSATKNPTSEERAAATEAMQRISQGAFDAFLMDLPLYSMWIDLGASGISTSSSAMEEGMGYRWQISTFSVTVGVRPLYTDPAGMIEEVNNVVLDFAPTGDTLYDRVLSIHDYVCALTTYTYDTKADYVYSAFGSLVDHRAVCEGYAEAFKLLCNANGIECILVTGQSNGENHMWNYVRMDDGKWYAVDPTWDDRAGGNYYRTYFLVGSDTVVVPRNGTTFSRNHVPNGYLSPTNLKEFAFPVLSSASYLENNPNGCPSNASTLTTASAKWYYNQLDDEQKNFYDHLLAITLPKGTYPDIIPGETDAWEAEPETTESETTAPDTSEPETTAPDTSEPETTVPETTEPVTTVPETTVPVTTEPETTVPVTTEPETTVPVTTEPETTEPVTTEPETTVPLTTEPETTEPVTTEPETTVPVTTVPETTVPVTTIPETTAPVITEPETTKADTTETGATLPGEEEITVEDTEPLSESVIPSESVLFVLIGTVGILGIAIAFLVPRIGKKT